MSDLYDSQRQMRNMRKAAIQRGVVAILDVGTSKIACLVLRFDGEAPLSDEGEIGSLAGQSGFRVIGAATTRSRGVKFGEINAMAETERAIRTALQGAQKMAGIRVDHVIACFSGGDPRSYGLDACIALDGEAVGEEDVARVLAACDVPDYGDGREVFAAITLWDEEPARLHETADAVEAAALGVEVSDGWELVNLRLVKRRILRDVAGPWAASIDLRARLLRAE